MAYLYILSCCECLISIRCHSLKPNRQICDVDKLAPCILQYSYRANNTFVTASVTVKQNLSHTIGSANFTLYKCSSLATHHGAQDCSLCLTRDPKYR